MQRRCPARSRKVWGHGTVSRSDGLWRIQGSVWRKSGAVQTLRLASFKRKYNTLKLCNQQPKTIFGDLYNYIRFYLLKRKIPPTQRSDDFVGWIGGKIDRVCCEAVCSFWAIIHWKWWLSQWEPTTSCGCVQWTRPHLVDIFRAIHKNGGIYKKIPLYSEFVKRVLENLLKWRGNSMTYLASIGITNAVLACISCSENGHRKARWQQNDNDFCIKNIVQH